MPEYPHKPNRIAIFILGILLSFAGGFGNVIIRESMDQTVYGSKGVMAIMKAPPLAVIPFIEVKEEVSQSHANKKLASIGTLALITVLLIAVHYAYKPLDVLMFIVLRNFGIELGV